MKFGAYFGAALTLAMSLALASAAVARPASPPPSPTLTVASADPAGTFGGVDYVRIRGVVNGTVGPTEPVAGLDAQPKDAHGRFAYTAEFELIAPAKGQPADDAVFVEAENRGSPIFLAALDQFDTRGPPSTAAYPAGLGDGFLFNHKIAYARVQWQSGIAAGVPATAQGVGEVIVRDFALRLAKGGAAPGLPPFKVRLIGAISQSAWFINAFIAEGFNVAPAGGGQVFNGAIAIDGTGNWMAVNQLGAKAGFPQYPYPNEASHPLRPYELLTRPQSDPLYIDVANFTDYFRLRASVSEDVPSFSPDMRRYDWPSPHAAGSEAGAARLAACNGGKPVALDPIGYDPYARALVVELARAAGAAQVEAPPLPATELFALGPAPDDAQHFNALAGMIVKVPMRDAAGQPIGGVRFPEDDAPVGKITVSLPPVGLDSISDTCGNFAEWAPMSAAELKRAYGSQDAYLKRYESSLDRLIAAGYVLPEDKPAMLKRAAALYQNPKGY
ncbi:MAG: alpha/beta hydrolase domain-containing protein [Caulobacteraceae bacterium]